jgi:hypothetical protein
MRQKTLIALAIVTVPLLAAAIFVPARHGTASKPVETGPVFPALKDWLSGTTKLTVTTATGGVISLARTASEQSNGGALPLDGWGIADKGGYPVLGSVIRPVIGGLSSLHTLEAKTERPKLYDRIEVDDPAANKESKAKLVELDDANGASILKIIIGRRHLDPLGSAGDAIYIRKPEDERAWLAQPAFDVPGAWLDWIDRTIVEIDPDKLKSLTLTPAGAAPLVLERDKAEDKWTIRDQPKDTTLRSETPGTDIAAQFRRLDLQDVRRAAEITGQPSATAQAVTFDGLNIAASLYDRPDGTWLEITATATGDAAKDADAIVKRTKGWAYKIPAQPARLLESKLADLLTPPSPTAEPAKPAPAAVPSKPAAKPPTKPGK